MPISQTHRHLTVTSSSLPMLKDALEVILGREMRPTHRLEAFARITGFRTWASLKAAIEQAGDTPLPLFPDLAQNDPFIATLPADLRRRMARLTPARIVDLAIAGCDLAWSPEFGHIGLDAIDDVDTLDRHIAEVQGEGRPLRFSIDPEFRRTLLISPENHRDLLVRAYDLEGIEVPDLPAGSWIGARLTPDEAGRYFHQPKADDIVRLGTDRKEIWELAHPEQAFSLSPFVFFSDQDRIAFEASFGEVRNFTRHPVEVMKPALAEIDNEEEFSFFEHGYYGTARCEIVAPEDLSADFALAWGAELLCVKVGYAYELARMKAA